MMKTLKTTKSRAAAGFDLISNKIWNEKKIGNSHIPLDPNPTFLGIKLDPKINYKEHLKIINSKQISKINLIRKIKSFKWRSSFKINRILYMSLIRSLFDYCFIILQSGTQNIRAEMQKMQNRTSIKTIHKELRIDLIDDRANKLFSKFITTRQSHEIIAQGIQDFLLHNSSRNNLKYKTPFDSIINTPNSNLLNTEMIHQLPFYHHFQN
ncbi:RNA-directed DNA polymerase from mobile element jockey-like [Brachionus plicatilis]|uniref:RNA-directed DNA polymerase from mobile element jockey-like n=1 Tax=Brachionus plicatilis TaxID=10195 RepID=A0A3M7SQG3_BRAPC|nr:RNA-directed DNA polymerase from mobile element jockey-like [Brachionus plicatilis]